MPNILNIIIERISRLVKVQNRDRCIYVMTNTRKIAREDCMEDIKSVIARIIKENEKYFIYEIRRTTINHILNGEDRQLRNSGYVYAIALEMFEKYGSFMYANDLCSYTHSPRNVKYELRRLIDTYGLERVTEEIAIYLKNNYSERLETKMICSQ